MRLFVKEDDKNKIIRSENYNYIFDKQDGAFSRWGSTFEEDPIMAPGPEILDLEISSGGDCLGNCPFCYKSNGGNQSTHNMTFEDFKTIFNKMPPTLTQIAFGIMNITTNPDFFKMMEYAKSHGIAPNYTCHGLDTTKEIAEKTSDLCGAVAVSCYNNEKTYDSIKMFTDAGMSQVNIHFMISEETYDRAIKIIDDSITDPRLAKLNAIVFLQLKQKGRGDKYNYVSPDKYKKLIEYAFEKNVDIGFDSCSAPLYFKSVEDNEKVYEAAKLFAEPCESTLFSSYINDRGKFYPCSFNEFGQGLDVLGCNDFIQDIWNHKDTKIFRDSLLKSSQGCIGCKSISHCRSCPTYPETAGCKYAINA